MIALVEEAVDFLEEERPLSVGFGSRFGSWSVGLGFSEGLVFHG